MNDPTEHIKKLVSERKAEQERIDKAERAWAAKLPHLEEVTQNLTEPFKVSGHPLFVGVTGNILAVQFDSRSLGVKTTPEGREAIYETGALLNISFDREDGLVYGHRRPFFADDLPVPGFERHYQLGEPGPIQDAQVGEVVATFLEWAAVGAGRGSKKLRFH